MSWNTKPGPKFDYEKHQQRQAQKAQEAELQRQEQERRAAEEQAKAARLAESLSRDVQTSPRASEVSSGRAARSQSAGSYQAAKDSYRIGTRTGVGCWGFGALYFAFMLIFSPGITGLGSINGFIGSLGAFGAPVIAYYIWRNFYRNYRSVIGFFAVGGGLLMSGIVLMLVIVPITN